MLAGIQPQEFSLGLGRNCRGRNAKRFPSGQRTLKRIHLGAKIDDALHETFVEKPELIEGDAVDRVVAEEATVSWRLRPNPVDQEPDALADFLNGSYVANAARFRQISTNSLNPGQLRFVCPGDGITHAAVSISPLLFQAVATVARNLIEQRLCPALQLLFWVVGHL
jgi:hypothetical protein